MFGDPVFLGTRREGGGTFDPAGSLLLTRSRSSSSSVDELPKRERYVLQVPGSLKIPTTDLPSHSQSRHTSPWQCDTWLRTLRSPMLCWCPHPPSYSMTVNDNRFRFSDSFSGAKKLPRFLIFNLTYHFITRCFAQLDIQLPVVRMREKNALLYCAAFTGIVVSGVALTQALCRGFT